MPSINGVAFTSYQSATIDGNGNPTLAGPVWQGACGRVQYASVCADGQGQVMMQIYATQADLLVQQNLVTTLSIPLPPGTTFDPTVFAHTLKSGYVQDAGCVLGHLCLQNMASQSGSPWAFLVGSFF